MRIVKQFTRKKNAFFREIKFNLINYRYRNKSARQPFNTAKIQHVLLLRLDDKVGDMVVTTGCAKLLADRGFKVSVLTGPVCQQMLAGADFLEQVYLYQPRMALNALRTAGFDAVVDFDDVKTYERFKLLADLRLGCVIGFNKQEYKLYDHSIPFLDSSSHISARYKAVARLFGIEHPHYHYHLPGDAFERERVKTLLAQHKGSQLCIAINPFTASTDKDFCRHQVSALIERLYTLPYKISVVMVGHSEKIRQLNLETALHLPDSNINSAVEIVRHCDLVITADTAIVHIARAFDKPMVAVYNKRKLKDTGLPGYTIWAPGYDKARQIVCEETNVADMTIDAVWPAIKAQVDALIAARQQA
ncbi:glycosyltransferase family 9 protein [Klebsiella michiganensis]|uniref:glycosyltransferase family 9 protein n=1 Tax=Klebsiella michiganensis TaxID=1134687 RepID=UPI000CDCE804|nr:glycosyltransferase family 9 protein [Klebsiella michiganensis]EKP1130468.1 glycosyltransferase family 9 protein [Klebsiella michiganensis]EKV4189810.1 glycosyltransferase family 9 protein [Klebsiella michiganensis]KAB7490931.1 glycosyltransferase family 9 protein [Klebsiella michiganensis]MBG2665584.1 glycosyltransferase family 9 protein [Klebsiella michiganensis]MBG2671631.1 glycosyltransferase family 9 protein [Klebsiella michiganensis]